ncbi:MAG TPA: FkbM family methyltransferase [Pyrinomonadaceae bacterium]
MFEIETDAAPAWVNLSRRGIRLLPRGRYPLMKWLCRTRVAPFDVSLGVTNDRIRFICDLRDDIAREACFMGYYEPQETALVRHLLRPGMCFVDVGANWGYFTLLAADLVGKHGRILAIEPHPMLFSLLERNISKNMLPHVTALSVAVADREGEMNLAGFRDEDANSGTSRLTHAPSSTVPNFRVATRLLEPLLDEYGAREVDLIKIDIEGAEGLVLATMSEGLRRAHYKHILLELHPAALAEQGTSPRAIIEHVLSFGYSAWRLDHSAEAFRRAAYNLPQSPQEFLSPLNLEAPFDVWPHVLLVAPDVSVSW